MRELGPHLYRQLSCCPETEVIPSSIGGVVANEGAMKRSCGFLDHVPFTPQLRVKMACAAPELLEGGNQGGRGYDSKLADGALRKC